MTAIRAHPTGGTAGSDTNDHIPHRAASPCPSQSLAEAHLRFTQSVTKGILELMRRCGYSRERATSTLLRELSTTGSVSPPTDDEIFYAMNLFGMGMEDASQALTVSRAVSRVMSERGLSAVDAIDDLTSKLSITRLLESNDRHVQDERPSSPRTKRASRMTMPEARRSSSPVTADHRAAAMHASRKMPPAKKIMHSKLTHHKKLKASLAATAIKHPRKRPAPEETTRARADSVSEELNAKVAKKKARLATEEGPSSIVASPESTTPRTKRALRSEVAAAEPNPAEMV